MRWLKCCANGWMWCTVQHFKWPERLERSSLNDISFQCVILFDSAVFTVLGLHSTSELPILYIWHRLQLTGHGYQHSLPLLLSLLITAFLTSPLTVPFLNHIVHHFASINVSSVLCISFSPQKMKHLRTPWHKNKNTSCLFALCLQLLHPLSLPNLPHCEFMNFCSAIPNHHSRSSSVICQCDAMSGW